MGTKTDTRTRGLLREYGSDALPAQFRREHRDHAAHLSTATYGEILQALEAAVESSDRWLFLRAVQPKAPYLRAFLLRTAEVLARDPAGTNAKSQSSRI